jgi:hypothetical protein
LGLRVFVFTEERIVGILKSHSVSSLNAVDSVSLIG